jgi:hypothetical protein
MTGFRNVSSASELSLDDVIERLNNFIRYGVERIETDESVPEDQFLTNRERTLIRVHPSREAWVKKVLADDWEKRRK